MLRCDETSAENITWSIHKCELIFKNAIYFMIMSVLPASMYCIMSMRGAHRVQKRVLDPLGLELGMAVIQCCYLYKKNESNCLLYILMGVQKVQHFSILKHLE